MPINNITQTISTIPEAAHRGIDVQTQFVIKQEDFQDHLQGTTVTELNTFKDQLNSRIGEINSTVTTMNGYADTASAGASTATTKAGEASTSASDALSYKNQAETFKNNASASATKASQWADNNYNVEVETGKYSAKHWSTVAQNATANKVDKVTSTDNAVVRFDGVTGQVQNSGVIINDNGNVGIGVTPSAWGSSYKAIGVEYYGNVSSSQTDASINLSSNTYYNGSNWIYKETGVPPTLYKGTSTGYIWRTAPSGTAGNTISWTNAMTLDANCSLTLNAGYNALASYFQCYNGGAGNTTYIQAHSTPDTSEVFNSTVGTVKRAAILANGTFQSATNVYGSTSDAKLKENVVETSDKLNKLMNVRVVNFNYIGDDQKQIGVIAQEVEKIFPGIVYETKDTKQVEVEKEREKTLEDGTVEIEKYTETETVETGEVTKNVKYSIIYMMMLKGMQEMNAKMEAMQLEIDELKGAK